MRRNISIIISIIILFAMIVVCCNLGGILLTNIAQSRQSSASVSSESQLIILDPGHGGVDAGKIGINNAEEKEINLKISKKIKKFLNDNGVSVMMTRTEDDRLSDTHKGDLEERVRIMNEEQPELVVSVHQNSYQSSEVKGPQVFYYTGSSEGRKAAEILQTELNKMDPSYSRTVKDNSSYYILKRAKVPVVIVECGFLSNAEEADKLINDEYQEAIAKAIAEGVMGYIN